MKYTISIDQEFAVIHDMTLTEVSCLAACFTLPTWSESYYIENKTWYWYSEEKMLEEFPLLFGVAKRVYKNLKILVDKGFILLSNIGRKKILCFTEKCIEWNKPKTVNQSENGLNQSENGLNQSENGLNQSENGLNQSENGLNQSENGLHNNNIIDNNIRDNYTIDKDGAKTDFSPELPREKKQKFSKEHGLTTENLNVRQSTIDKIDAAFEQLVFPIDDVEIKKLFFVLCCSPKWRCKTIHAIQMNLNKTQNYNRDFTIKLIEDSIAGGWQGLVYADTDKKYEEFLKRQSENRVTFKSGSTTFVGMTESEREEMRRLEEYLNE